MKRVSYALTILFATWAPSHAQTGVNGTWRVEGAGPQPWEVVLRTDGARLTGMVSSCISPRVEISEGRVDGNTLTFKCTRSVGSPTITFTGRLNGDEIAFTRDVPDRDLNNIPSAFRGMFGASAAPRFTAKRVPDGDLAEFVDRVRGMDLVAGVNLLQRDVKADGRLFLPRKVSRVRAVIVASSVGLGDEFYVDRQVRRLLEVTESGLLLLRIGNIGPGAPVGDPVRNAGLGGADGLLLLLQRLAQESGHQELADAPLLLWGHSAGGAFAASFARLHPERTIAFVRYHSAGAGLVGADMKVLGQIPALLLSGANDAPEAAQSAATFGKIGRSAGAPWTFAVEPAATHAEEESRQKANDLVIPWITAVLRQRVSSDGKILRAVTDGSAWLGNDQTGEAAPFGTFTGSKPEASWLPDEATARGWRVVIGATK